MSDQTKAPDRIWIAPTYQSNWVDDFYLLDPKYRGNRGIEYVRADLLEAAEAQLKVIEDWGTEDINAAVDLRQKLAQVRVELNATKAENDKLRATLRNGVELISGDKVGSEWKRGCQSFLKASRAALNHKENNHD